MTYLCPMCHSIRARDLPGLHMYDSSPALTSAQPSGLINRIFKKNLLVSFTIIAAVVLHPL